ncbi:MAG: DUF433 domain-containing protein [Candidatus Diapherotrites archaeon]|nr:DUF433 domain-containing protein [Candidatus Diapherotrites archaeon]
MQSRIIFDSKILSGKPIIKGTRISVEFILELLASGTEMGDILVEYPHLKREDVLAAVDYAAKAMKHEELIVVGK